MKRIAVVVAAVLLLILTAAFVPHGQRPDRSYDTSIEHPAFTATHPLVLVDEAHDNAHTIRSGYSPFASLLRNDGLRVEANDRPFTAASLRDARVLVIVNAAGGWNPKLFGFNLQPLRRGRRDASAFTAAEVTAVRDWVRQGGALLLVADHYPYGAASASLAAAFGVAMNGGFAEVPGGDRSTIEFSRDKGLLAEHPITAGLRRVLSFTGQSLTSPESDALLRLPPNAVEYVPPPPRFHPARAGNAQAVALQYGKGRVVIFGEAAMLTAQIDDRGRKFGMNVAGCDNRQLVLNTLHWLILQ